MYAHLGPTGVARHETTRPLHGRKAGRVNFSWRSGRWAPIGEIVSGLLRGIGVERVLGTFPKRFRNSERRVGKTIDCHVFFGGGGGEVCVWVRVWLHGSSGRGGRAGRGQNGK